MANDKQRLSEKGLCAALDHKRGANRDVARREVETIIGAYLAAARVAGCPDEQRERVARAIFEAQRRGCLAASWPRTTWDDLLDFQREGFLSSADAALGAVAASPDERQVDPVIPSSGAAESRGGRSTGPVCDARLQKGN